MNLSCYVLDDEQAALDLLCRFVERTPGLYLAGCSTDPVLALAALSAFPLPDVLFSDIRMPELSGLALAELVDRRTKLVFTTSYREHAAEAFGVSAFDYLLKPIAYDRFLACIQKMRAQSATTGSFFVRTGLAAELKPVTIADIIYVAAAQNYVELHTGSGRLTTLTGIGDLLAYLPATGFSRIHRSYIINHAHISCIKYDELELCGKIWLTIGRAYREAFQAKISRLILPTQQRV